MGLSSENRMEFGIHTFGDTTFDADGQLKHDSEVIRNVLEEAILADSLGIDCFGVGEHHRPDFVISAPETMLADPESIKLFANEVIPRVHELLEER